MGPNVQSFEQEFATRVGVKHAIAMNSCTSTLEAALLPLQELIKVRKESENKVFTQNLCNVAFVPLTGKDGWRA